MRARFHVARWIAGAPNAALVSVVVFYRVVLSPIKFSIFGPGSRCRFEPSCSGYALEALRVHGALRGSWLGMKRLLRCHPWGAFGADPVPPRQNAHSHAAGAERICC
jgi:putative membrane protein insertion efficiency factor